MDRERQREIASKGGRAAHAKGTAHEWTADEARSAGRKGGETVSRDREHMAAIGREGGGARSANARARRRLGENGNGRGDSVVEDMSRVSGVGFNGDGEMSAG
jgi:general stress protein YciG